MPIMQRQLSTAKRTVNPGGRLLREEGLAMIVFTDAGFKLGWRVRRRINKKLCASASKQPKTPLDEGVAMTEPKCFT
ncbi:MAG: hypothetical protein M3178_08275 [Pseudomonadota bacterium]|nr:hypothetical protein [Pseudomonadota bacterium]